MNIETERNFSADGVTGMISLFGIEFKMCEADLEGYASLEDISKEINTPIEKVKEILIKHELLNAEGELIGDDSEDTITLADESVHNMPNGYFAVLPCPVSKEPIEDVIDMSNKKTYIYGNVEFIRQLMQKN